MLGRLSHSFARRFLALWQEKLVLTVLLNLLFWLPYSLLARNAFFPLRSVPETFLDRVIPFQPEWTLVYLSEYLLTFFAPWLITRKDELRRYSVGMLLMSALCFCVFLLAPSASPRPHVVSEMAAYRFVLFADGPLNAFPSLHAAFLAYTLPMIKGWVRRSVFVAIVLWAAGILYATIATRQHFALDLLAGVGVGYASHRIAWRARRPPLPASASTCFRGPSQFQTGSR
jgi:membrane-associated phospholipid phosphatase